MQQKRVTQRDVARAAGVSRTAVSLALRHHRSIPESTRQRIVALADKMGYVPDPILSALAGYRWPASQPRRSMASVALVELRARNDPDPSTYPVTARRGAIARAQAAGFSVSLFNLHDYGGSAKRLLRVLRNRGITGIVLLPVGHPITLDPKAGWENFSVVAATTSVLTPRFHRVIPNQHDGMSMLLEKMHEAGYQRIGAIFSERFDRRTTHAFSMALAWFGHRNRILILPSDISPAETDRRIATWLRTHEVEIAFAQDPGAVSQMPNVRKVLKAKPNVRIVAIGTYIEQLPDLIGETAVRVLSGMMYNNETGIPEHPQITIIDGWVRESAIPAPVR